MSLLIRDERRDDAFAIRGIVSAAFSGAAEADLIDTLRAAGDLAVSLVATRDGAIAGHIALSRLRAPKGGLALAPLAVAPAEQRRGIGATLVAAALERSREDGYGVVFVLGDPAYYARFGFSLAEAARYTSPYSGPHFMALRIANIAEAAGDVIYPPAFAALG